MSSSGLIYALIVGAWAVYLVPIWLRREDELNEARETERFTAAIRVLGKREAALRRAAGSDVVPDDMTDDVLSDAASTRAGGGRAQARTLADEGVSASAGIHPVAKTADTTPVGTKSADTLAAERDRSAITDTGDEERARGRRGRLVARRRRVVAVLLALSFVGVVSTAVLGVDFLWLTGAPGALFVAYAVHVRHDERRRLAEREARRRRLAAERRRARMAELAAQAEAARAQAARAEAERARAEAEAERVRADRARAAAAARRQRQNEAPTPKRADQPAARGRRRPVRPVARADEYIDRPRAVGE